MRQEEKKERLSGAGGILARKSIYIVSGSPDLTASVTAHIYCLLANVEVYGRAAVVYICPFTSKRMGIVVPKLSEFAIYTGPNGDATASRQFACVVGC